MSHVWVLLTQRLHSPGLRILTAGLLSRGKLSLQRLMSPVCFTREDQRPSLDVSGLVSFSTFEEEIAIDDSMSSTASDADKWVCSDE